MEMEWQPIKTAPKVPWPMLFYFPDNDNGYRVRISYWDLRSSCWGFDWPYKLKSQPTHWMPIPSEP